MVDERFACRTETMQWSQRDTKGDVPPACRAHTTTLVDRKLVVFGGGQGAIYYDTVYVLDISTRTWTRPNIKAPFPPCRRAHTAVLYQQKIWVFGGGNGMTALHDVWTLDVSDMAHMKWEQQHPTGRKPDPRGYHTANLVGNVMIVVGGSNAKEFFHDIWCLDLGMSDLGQKRDAFSPNTFLRHFGLESNPCENPVPADDARHNASGLLPVHIRWP